MSDDTEYKDVVIIGAGLSGIGAACYLKRNCPSKTFSIIEARSSIGGTWDLFKYPGVRSDSDMYTLGYKFKPWEGAKSIFAAPLMKYQTGGTNPVAKQIEYMTGGENNLILALVPSENGHKSNYVIKYKLDLEGS